MDVNYIWKGNITWKPNITQVVPKPHHPQQDSLSLFCPNEIYRDSIGGSTKILAHPTKFASYKPFQAKGNPWYLQIHARVEDYSSWEIRINSMQINLEEVIKLTPR